MLPQFFDFFSDTDKNEIKEVPLSDEATVLPKRKTQEAEENREVSADFKLSFGYQSKTKKTKIHKELVSTNLTLFDETWPTDNKKPYAKELSEADLKETEMACNIAAMKNYRPGEEEEEKRKGLPTKLELYLDPWIIKKKLTRSDLNNLSRLLLKTSLVEKHVLPLMDVNIVNKVERLDGLGVTVCDQDTNSLHHLVFKKWRTCKSYILHGRWVHDFVHRRNLKEGDVIGMYWDPNCSRFNFCVLNRSPTIQPAAANGTSISTR